MTVQSAICYPHTENIMAAGRVKRSPGRPPGTANTKLVQVRITPKAMEMLEAKARAEALSTAAYHRRVLYRHLGLIEGEN